MTRKQSTKDQSNIETTVLIIGAGASGLRAAIELASQNIPCLLVGKRLHGDAHTKWAAGGINAALGSLDQQDSWEVHAADTIREGHELCQPDLVATLAQEIPQRIFELEDWGCEFNKTESGAINQRYFGAQSYRRTCFVGDITGEAILSTLVKKAQELRVPFRQNLFITQVLCEAGQVYGAQGFDLESGELVRISSQAVILAAGGYTSIYQRNSSRRNENTGDAIALAYYAGAELRDMEFVQFHPTGMIAPKEWQGRLVTEAVRGEGGILRNANGGRFMERYSPKHMELDARDLVARAIFQEIAEGRGTKNGGVWLDISHKDASFIEERLPKIARQFREQGIDIAREAMEVAPTAHYSMGGIKVDPKTGETRVQGLYAIGEASSGVHGANRLGGNSLAETVVFGQRTGQYLASVMRESSSRVGASRMSRHIDQAVLVAVPKLENSKLLIERLGLLMGEHGGIIRSKDALESGLQQLDQLKNQAAQADAENFADKLALEAAYNLQFMLLAAEAVLRGSLLREESRGAHFRSDFPNSDAAWKQNIVYARSTEGEMQLTVEPLPAVPAGIRRMMEKAKGLDYHHLE